MALLLCALATRDLDAVAVAVAVKFLRLAGRAPYADVRDVRAALGELVEDWYDGSAGPALITHLMLRSSMQEHRARRRGPEVTKGN